MGLEFREVEDERGIELAAQAADEIWHEYWPARIGAAQTDYMVDTMQSVEAIAADIAQRGYRYWLLYDEAGELAGYTAAAPEDFSDDPHGPQATKHGTAIAARAARRLFISKIYLYAHQRGKHYASRVIEHYEALCREQRLPVMYLTVNRGNDLAIRAYEARGFRTVEDVDAPIGEGFVMYDHIMAKDVPPA